MENLKKLRKVHGLSQQGFADLFNLSQQSVYKYEHSISEPNIQTLTEIADYFNTSVDYLVDYTDISSPVQDHREDFSSLSPEEQKLITHYRNLSADYKSAIMVLMSTHLKELNEEE